MLDAKTNDQLREELATAHRRIAELESMVATNSTSLSPTDDRRICRTALSNLPAGVLVVEVPTGEIVFINQQAQEWLGDEVNLTIASQDDLAHALTAYRYGTDEQYPINERPLIRAMAGENCRVDDMEIRTADGERILVQVLGYPIRDITGDVIYSMAIFQDITEFHQAQEAIAESEQKFRTLFEFASEGMIVVNDEGEIVLMNSTAEEMFGYNREELLGERIEKLVPPHIRDVHRQHRDSFVNSAERRPMGIGLELQGRRKDGSEFPVEISLSSIKTKTGYLTMSYIIDITQQKQLQMQRDQLQEDIIEAQQQFIQELSTPIIPIIEGVIILPLIGSIDSMRAKDLMHSLLQGISQHQAKIVIIDITGVPMIDTGIANHFDKTIQATRLKGARTIITGMADAVAETIVDLGLDWSGVETVRDLQGGLVVALRNLGLKLQ